MNQNYWPRLLLIPLSGCSVVSNEKHSKEIGSTIFLSLIIFCSLSVQADETEICRAILKDGVHDKYDTFTTRKKFKQVYSLISSKELSEWGSAKDAQATFGINFIDILDAALGGSSSENNYTSRRSEFLKVGYDQLSSQFGFKQYLEIASTTLANAFVKCIDIRSKVPGFTAWIVPGRNLSTFSINAKNVVSSGSSDFEIRTISVLPSKGVTCDNPEIPFSSKSSDFVIGCEKPSDSTVQVTVRTDAGNLSGIDVIGYEDAISELRQQVNALGNSGALVPRGAVGFFALNGCPAGWDDMPSAAGRYMVGKPVGGTLAGMQGEPLTNLENRPSGNHKHDITLTQVVPAQYIPHRGKSKDVRSKTLTTENPKIQEGMSFKDGTNAPYVQLLTLE